MEVAIRNPHRTGRPTAGARSDCAVGASALIGEGEGGTHQGELLVPVAGCDGICGT